jgi:hypothetical protein
MVRNLFIEKNVVCPVCKNGFGMKFPNPKLYAAARRDSDRRVTAYTWAQGIQTDIVPHYYAIIQCPQCMFADLKEALENPRNSAKERTVHDARNKLDFKKVMILKKLRRLAPDQGNLNLDGAISIHLAALYCALLPGNEEDIDHNKLGRLFLRLSWLYREQKGEVPEADEKNGEAGASQVLEKLYRGVEGLQSGLSGFFDDVAGVRDLIRQRAAELGLPQEGDKNPYWPMVAAISDKMMEMQTLIEMLSQSVISDKKGKLPVNGISGDDGGAQRLLGDISSQWVEMPRTEEICVKKAVAAFDYSFKKEDTDHSVEQGLAVVNLIIKLLLKIGDLYGALDYASQIFKSGFRDKQELSRRLSQGKQNKTLNAFDEKNIRRKIGTINSFLTQAGDSRRNIMEMVYEKEKEKLLPILKANVENTAGEQAAAVVEAGFPEDMIPFLRDKGLIKQDEDKKGWFGRKK